jgi:hypothetical protein
MPTISHLLGHQDRHNDYEDLTLPSQLNVNADALATHELDEFSTPKPIVPFDPSSMAILHLDGRTITRDLESVVTQPLPPQTPRILPTTL